MEWRTYCDSAGGGTRDPSKHTREFLAEFFDMRASGELPSCELPLHEQRMPAQD